MACGFQCRPQRFNAIEIWCQWRPRKLWPFILVLRKQVPDDLSRLNRDSVVLEDIITITGQSLYHGIDAIVQNLHVILWSNVFLQSYRRDKRKSRYGCLISWYSWQQAVCLIRLGWRVVSTSDHKVSILIAIWWLSKGRYHKSSSE